MRNRTDVEKEIEKINQAKARAEGDLVVLRKRETEEMQQAGEDYLSGGALASTPGFGEIRGKREIAERVVAMAGEKVKALQAEILELERQAGVEHCAAFEVEYWALLEVCHDLIAGLKKKLDELEGLVAVEELQPFNMRKISQEGSRMLDGYRVLWTDLSRHLFTAWNGIENLNQYNPKMKAKSGRPGFGKMP